MPLAGVSDSQLPPEFVEAVASLLKFAPFLAAVKTCGSWGDCHTSVREKGNCCPSTITNPYPVPGSRRTFPRLLLSPVGHRKSAKAVTEDARICISLLLHRTNIAVSIAAFGLSGSPS